MTVVGSTPIRVGIIDPVPADARETRAAPDSRPAHCGARCTRSRTRSSALVGSAELALDDVEPGTKLHDRIALTHRTGIEIAEIVRALQAFIRLQDEPARPLSLGEAATEAVALVEGAAHDADLSCNGAATPPWSRGRGGSRTLVELLVDALERATHAARSTLEVSDGVVTATAAASELRGCEDSRRRR